ncbi:hypothetical protein [Bryobacter aggregatus]|uniref:hypothetical protein n=1 Tax=Bryobacter aggregatus TaxID=360054 RepID=UPI0012BAA760|nr:hypothetical protein [Bryobacter aggregatus]
MSEPGSTTYNFVLRAYQRRAGAWGRRTVDATDASQLVHHSIDLSGGQSNLALL